MYSFTSLNRIAEKSCGGGGSHFIKQRYTYSLFISLRKPSETVLNMIPFTKYFKTSLYDAMQLNTRAMISGTTVLRNEHSHYSTAVYFMAALGKKLIFPLAVVI
jgi:hypothetical protein